MKNNLPKILLAASLLFFIGFCFVFVFLYKKTNTINEKAQTDIVTWQKEAQRREDIKSLNQLLEQIEVDRVKLETHFAKSSDIVPFLDTIEKLAPKAGATAEVDSVNIGADKNTLVVGLKATGSFEAIYKFLTLLENSPYELEFLSMDIHSTAPDVADKTGKGSRWEAILKMQLLTFVP